MNYLVHSEINRYNQPYQIILKIVKYLSFVINIINILGVLYLILINLFLILISKLVLLTSDTVRTKYVYPAAGHVITDNLKIISDLRIRSIIAKGPKYRFFYECGENNAASLNEYCSRWCKREHVECDALKDWKLNIFKIIDRHISFFSQNTNMLPRKFKISYR